MPMSTRDLFARMIKCEAGGEGLNGMQAVATTIMNRVHVPYGEYLRVGQGDPQKSRSTARTVLHGNCHRNMVSRNPRTYGTHRLTRCIMR
jgi:hypothetical protein